MESISHGNDITDRSQTSKSVCSTLLGFALLESRPHIHSKYYNYDPLGIKRCNIDGVPLFCLHQSSSIASWARIHPFCPRKAACPPGPAARHVWDRTTLTGDKCPERGHQHSWAPGTEVNWPDRKEVLPRPNREKGVPVPWSVASGRVCRGQRPGGRAGLAHTEATGSLVAFLGYGCLFSPNQSLDPSQLLAFQWGEAQRWAVPPSGCSYSSKGCFLGPKGRAAHHFARGWKDKTEG